MVVFLLEYLKIHTFFLFAGVPGKLRAIHVLNVVYFFDKILTLIKPFLKAEVLRNLFLHPSNTDMEKFYRDYIPKSCLPSDFGGDLASVEELHEQSKLEFMRLRPYYIAEEKQAALLFDDCEKNSFEKEELKPREILELSQMTRI